MVLMRDDEPSARGSAEQQTTRQTTQQTPQQTLQQTTQTAAALRSVTAERISAGATQVSGSSGAITRSQSSTTLSGELLLRVSAQNELIEALEIIYNQANEPFEEMTSTEIEWMNGQVEELHQTFRAEQAWLVTHWPPAHVDHPYFNKKLGLSESKTFIKVQRILSRLKDQLTTVTPRTPTMSPEPHSRFRLPEITVPTFSGDTRAWSDFIAMFDSVIGVRADISDLEQFQYLKNAVKDEAADLIKNLTQHPSSYQAALKLLKTRYENKRIILNSHLERLLSLKPMSRRQATLLTKLVNILNETSQAIATLANETGGECILVAVATRLLDEDTRERWECSLVDSNEIHPLS